MPKEEETKDTQTTPAPTAPIQPEAEGDDSELLAMRDQVAKNLEDKKGPKKTYSEDEMTEIVSRMSKKFAQKRESDDEEFIDLLDPNAVKRKMIRLARMNGKFVVALKNMNTDSYSDTPKYTENVENPLKKGEMIPWTTLIYDDGTEEFYPYLSFMNRATGSWGEVIEEKNQDISEKFGLIDVKVVDDNDEWNMKNTGKKVLAKALKFKTIYIVKDIKGGKMLEVLSEVVNLADAPWSEAAKYLEATKK